MGRVREFQKDDTGEVAELWAKEFHLRESVPLDSLSRYLEEVFFLNPWQSGDFPSLVYEDSDRRIAGFVGVMPRPMRFMGKSIKAAVASQIVVDRSKGLPFAALELFRKFFSGPQDLSFSDGANGLARRVWEAAGGSVAMLYSPLWTRILRPAQYLVNLCENRRLLGTVAKASRPISWALDAAAVRIADGPYCFSEPESIETEPAEEAIIWCLRHLAGHRALQPEYDLDSLKWLLKKAGEQKKHGELRKGMVQSVKGEILGWYLYYAKPGAVSQVLQIGGKLRSIAHVLNHLFYQAWQQGAIAVSGQTEPEFALELSSSHCGFTWPGGVLVQSRNKDILDVIHRGNAFLTRLEGEWWMRFCDLSETGNDKQISSFRRAAVNGTVSKSGASTGSAADDWAQKGCQGTNNGARQAAVCAG